MAPSRANRRRAQNNKHVKLEVQEAQDDGVPQVFKDMLAEDAAESRDVEYRSAKRRRVGERAAIINGAAIVADDAAASNDDEPVQARTQVIEDLDQESDADDFEWEEVDTLGISNINIAEKHATAAEEDLNIVIDDPKQANQPRQKRLRKPVSASEKRIRLDVHKAHLLCLLFHTYQRNHWCNDQALQRSVRRSLRISAKLVEKIHPTVPASQFQKSNWLKEALKELLESWRSMFSISRHGLRRSTWNLNAATTDQELTESFVDLREFRDNSTTLSGSADYGAQLFCALLRGLGLETRLVCSLQPLPFATTAATVSPAKAPVVPTIYVLDTDDELHGSDSAETSPTSRSRRIRRLGGGHRNGGMVNAGTAPASISRPARIITRPRHPIFWVEVFDPSYQSWIPVDPMATGNIGKALSLEPGLNDPENLLSYVIAFEEDNTARDVTRRYTKAYNAKTRRLRVECTDNGIKWYKRALRLFRRRRKLDRDVVEEGYFTQRDVQEGMPKNIDDFRGHPVYVLERHLYRDEALHPKHEVGKVGQRLKAATSLANLESVYRRQDVHIVKSADKWFRQGRKLKNGAQPLKHVKARKRQEVFEDVDSGVPDQSQVSLGLYAHFQTELYIPPPVTIDGLLPRNEFGNLDIYTRSMIPAGAVHVKSPYSRQAARLLGIDHVDAVTGFNFKGRHGTAIVNGVVVASECREAMESALEGIAYSREREMATVRRERALALWRKFVLGLRIVESVKQYKKADESTEDEGSDDEYLNSSEDQHNLESGMQRYGDGIDHEIPAISMLPEIEPFEIVESIHKLPEQIQPPPPQSIVAAAPVEDYEEGGFIRDAEVADTRGMIDLKSELGATEGGFIREASPSALREKIASKEAKMDALPEDAKTGANEASVLPATISETISPPNEMDVDQSVEPDTADRESLLSHDPDDDEVDPDWVD